MQRFVKAELKEKESHIVVYTDESGARYEFSGGTWAWRNHNPGNVRPGMISKRNGVIGFVTVDKKDLLFFPMMS